MKRVPDASNVDLHHDDVMTEISHWVLFDEGAYFAAIGYYELQVVAKLLIHHWNGKMDLIPRNLACYTHW